MALELVGGALVTSFLQFAFDRLGSREILDYFRERKLNETLVKRLNTTLLSINAVIDDAENKQIGNRNVKAWINEVKDAVYEAEDLLDEVDTELFKRKQLEAESGNSTACKVCTFFSASVSSFDKEIKARMKQVLDNLEYLASQKDILGLREGGGELVSQRMPSTSLVDETVIYGRDDDKEMIVKWLLSDKENGNCPYSIISIVGMGGMGKTTLAQLVYNDERLKDEYDLKAWVCVSEEFNLLKVTRAILEAITSAADDSKQINMLQLRLKEKLSGKRFLLVLDDVWNENHMQWEALQTPFIYGAQGSKILITSRSDKVASAARSVKIHQLMQLPEDGSWLLFAKYAFRDIDPQSNSDLEEIGRKIVMKCKGLPLALKATGSLLYTKSSSEEWTSILTSDIWDMSSNESDIFPALRLSYYYLPSLIKRCFAYCSIFPKGYKFDKEHLVRLWMAENLLPLPQQDKSMKEIGDLFFHDLLARSFFQQSSEDKAHFLMHDLVNDLAKYVSGEFCFKLEVEDSQPENVSKMTRYFSYIRQRNEASKRFEAMYKANRLRTFLPLSMYRGGRKFRWISSNIIHDLLSKLKCLRVLSLSGYLNITELPDSIGNLKHLRYLDLSGTQVKKLPDSTCLLYNLQTLKLRYCLFLVELPSDLYKLINLRHLDIRKTKVRKMPIKLGKLKQLQVLTSFFAGRHIETDIKQLGELNLSGKLSIMELQNVFNPVDALAVNLKNKMHLEKLRLEWSIHNDESQKQGEVLEKLQPHKNLKELSIKYYGGKRFPDWFGDNSLRNMVSLKLHNCRYCFLLPPLGLLPSLKALSVMGFDATVSIGGEFYGNSSSTIPFGSLEILQFENMLGWEEWECKDNLGAFSGLQTLCLRNCPRLKEQLPRQIPSLKLLVIENCQQLVASVPQATAIHQLTLLGCGRLQLGYTTSLKNLKVGGSHMEGSLLEKIQHAINNTFLKSLEIVHCLNMELSMHHCHNFLIVIYIQSSCESLRTFPLDFFPKLQQLWLERCINLEMISVSEGHDDYVTSLTWLKIWECPKFVSFPRGGLAAPKLEWFRIADLKNLKSLPEHMNTLLPSLRGLILIDCPQLESFPDGGLPSNLKTLFIYACSKLVASRMNWGLQMHTSLDNLCIEDANVESFPEEGLLPPCLTSLCFYNCSKLKMLDYKGLCLVPSLKQLVLQECPRLESLPKEGLPSSISTLEISDCPLLKKRCQKREGKDWRKIAHVHCVHIDNDILT